MCLLFHRAVLFLEITLQINSKICFVDLKIHISSHLNISESRMSCQSLTLTFFFFLLRLASVLEFIKYGIYEDIFFVQQKTGNNLNVCEQKTGLIKYSAIIQCNTLQPLQRIRKALGECDQDLFQVIDQYVTGKKNVCVCIWAYIYLCIENSFYAKIILLT